MMSLKRGIDVSFMAHIYIAKPLRTFARYALANRNNRRRGIRR